MLLRVHRPTWTRPFVKELPEEQDDLDGKVKKPSRRFATTLFIFSFFGLALQIAKIFYPTFHFQAVFPVVSWVSCSLMLDP